MNIIKGEKGTYTILKDQPHQKGKFGGITVGLCEEDKCLVSIKKITKKTVVIDNQTHAVLPTIKHANLGHTIEYIHNQDGLFMIRKYYEGTDLKTIIKKRSRYKHLGNKFYIKAFIHLLDGLDWLHQNGIVHRDIKPSNIIIPHANKSIPREWNPEDVVLIDLEQSSTYPVSSNNRSPFAIIYSPPEQLLNYSGLISPGSDLFSLAITLFETIAKKPPYEDCNAEILLNLQLTYPLQKPSKMDEPLFDILKKAAYKEPFPLPPKRLAPNVILELLKKGISKRYHTSNEFKNELSAYLSQLPAEQPKKTFFSKLFSLR